ncbi:MAG: hypothetical protein K9M99_00335 [Candidatus Cloacimonetes bacterium]|nr:hypothetical protein [Candidatus Cloacimonadota bacterium]
MNKLPFLTGITCLYFLSYPLLFKFWYNALLRLLPLFIAILIFSVLSRNNFYDQLLLIARIAFLLLLSVFLINTSTITELFTFLPARFAKINQFLTATLLFIPVFMESYAKARQLAKKPADIIALSLELTHEQIDNIRNQIDNPNQVCPNEYNWKADLIGIMILLINGFLCFM